MSKFVCDLTGGGPNSLLASVRLAKAIAQLTAFPLLTPKMLKEGAKQFCNADLLVMPNLPKLLIKEVDTWDAVVATAKRIIWVQNDYNIWAPSPTTSGESMFTRGFTERIRKGRPTEVWSSCPTRITDDYGTYVNWNALQYLPQAAMPSKRIVAVLYYGAFRKGRQERFKQFIGEGTVVSAPRTATERFKELCPDATYVEPFKKDLIQQIAEYKAGLYMEDRLSTKQFHSPANRVYEMISAQQAMFVDEVSVSSLEKGGFPVDTAWIVDGYHTCQEKLKYAGHIAAYQQKRWAPIAAAQNAALKKKIRSLRSC